MMSAGVIGWPVAHSKSPLIHRFWLAKLGIDGDYGRFAVVPDRLGDAIRALPALGLRGVNVTVPHKVAVMAFLDRVDPLAAKVGAVNTVVVEDGALVGYNTDVEGFIAPLRAMLGGQQSAGATCLHLIGTGGAARAVAQGWQEHGDLVVFARDPAKANWIAAEFAGGSNRSLVGTIDQLSRDPLVDDTTSFAGASPRSDDRRARFVVVNATSLGMTVQPPLHVNLDCYPDDTIVYDLVYAPLDTPLLVSARNRGLRTVDGLAMLVGQAAAAFELFFGAPAPREHDAELRALLTA
jgi:shikimate dehydrogenase